MAKSRSKKGRTKYNRQWVREHKLYLARLPDGKIDKQTGRIVKV